MWENVQKTFMTFYYTDWLIGIFRMAYDHPVNWVGFHPIHRQTANIGCCSCGKQRPGSFESWPRFSPTAPDLFRGLKWLPFWVIKWELRWFLFSSSWAEACLGALMGGCFWWKISRCSHIQARQIRQWQVQRWICCKQKAWPRKNGASDTKGEGWRVHKFMRYPWTPKPMEAWRFWTPKNLGYNP